jgi:1-acyl-sn-glycerol-3-phosphate acyltransferase
MGMVFIERQAAREATRRLQEARAIFDSGHSLCAFPEGTRSRNGRVGPFKGGIFKLALEAGVPILPIAIEGSAEVLPSAGFRVRPGRIRIRAGTPIPTVGLAAADRQALATRCHDAVVALLKNQDRIV